MKNLRALALTLCLVPVLSISCGTIREIPVKEIVKEVVRDSIIVKKDTVEIEVPKEIVKEVLPQVDTSHLETTLASSTAFLDTTRRVIHHTLKNKPQEIKKEIKIQEKIIYKDRIVEKEVPVEVPKPVVPKWCWILLTINVAFFGVKIGKYFLH